jgi:hypothetical protein
MWTNNLKALRRYLERNNLERKKSRTKKSRNQKFRKNTEWKNAEMKKILKKHWNLEIKKIELTTPNLT